jgi:TolB protein
MRQQLIAASFVRVGSDRQRASLMRGAFAVALFAPLVAVAPSPAQAASAAANGHIVFSSNRDGNDEIVIARPDGTDRVNLTQNPATDFQPRLSPDGRRIAFVSNRSGTDQIWVMRANGSQPHQLTTQGTSHHPDWTAGGLIVFQSDRTGASDIYRMNADGSQQVDLTNDPSDDRQAAAAPTGDLVAFASNRDGGSYHLYTIHLDGTGLAQLTSEAGDQYVPAFSPDGTTVAFSADTSPDAPDNNLWSIGVDGNGLQQLTATPDLVEANPAWSPNGRRLIFEGCTDAGQPDQQCQLYAMPAHGGTETNISTPPTFTDSFSDGRADPFWYVGGFGTGYLSVEINGRLEQSLAADATPDPGTGFLFATYYSHCQMVGNFDERVSYTLLDWPSQNSASAALKSNIFGGGDTGDAFRQSVPWGELYSSYIPPSFSSILTTDQSGALRVVRHGSITTTYYRSGHSWIEIGSGLSIPGPSNPAINLEVDGVSFAHQFVRVAWTNFTATADAWTCPSWWQDESPDWGR